MRKSQRGMTLFSLTLAATLAGFASAAPAMAMGDDPGALNEVCLPLDSGKIDTVGDPLSVVLTAPEGMVITGYCVMTDSDNQSDIPVYPELRPDQLNQNSIEVTYPYGKAVSHSSFSYAPASTTPTDPTTPTKTLITEQPLPPTFVDECGYVNDRYEIPPYDPAKPYYYVITPSVDGMQVKVQVIPSLRYEFDSSLTTTWEFAFVNNECGMPVFIVDQPQAPTIVDKCGTADDVFALPADTVQYYYAMTGHMVYVVEKAGFILQQDLITSWPIVFTDTACEVVEAPAEVTPPADAEIPATETPAPVEVAVEVESEAAPVAEEVSTPTEVVAASVVDTSADVAVAASDVQESKLAETGADQDLLWWAGLAAVLLFVVGIPAARINRARVIKK
jgi:hypothetical protein